MDLDDAKKKKELGQYTAILTSRLVNNAYAQHNKKYHVKVRLNSFHVNGQTVRFYPQIQNL